MINSVCNYLGNAVYPHADLNDGYSEGSPYNVNSDEPTYDAILHARVNLIKEIVKLVGFSAIGSLAIGASAALLTCGIVTAATPAALGFFAGALVTGVAGGYFCGLAVNKLTQVRDLHRSYIHLTTSKD